jgi:hypothetical protein
LEYRQEKAQKDAAAQREAEEQPRRAQEAYQRNLGFLAGRWTGTETTHFELISNCRNCTPTNAIAADIEIAGKKITIKQTWGVDLVGNIAGSDPASIQWEIARSNSYVGEPVSVFVSPSRIYYKLPVYEGGRPDIGRPGRGRVDGYFEIDLRK